MSIPRKRFGQHFLRDADIIQRIIASLAIQPQDHVIEIGPGQGALTFPLLALLSHLEVIEVDRDLVAWLRVQTQGNALQIYEADVLSVDFNALKKDDRLLRVLGNLPYNISTPLIFHLLQFAPIISDMVFMLQKEVAHRLCAKENTDDYGRLSVIVQYYCQVHLLFDVPATAFYPPPQVCSTVIQLIPHRSYPYVAKDEALFRELVKQAFGQRRKTLRNSLKNKVSPAIWEKVGIRSDCRPENLSLKQFVDLANAL